MTGCPAFIEIYVGNPTRFVTVPCDLGEHAGDDHMGAGIYWRDPLAVETPEQLPAVDETPVHSLTCAAINGQPCDCPAAVDGPVDRPWR